VLIVLSPNVWPGAATDTGTPLPFTLANPGIISIPLGFLGCIAGTLLSSERVSEHSFHELFVRSETGLGAEKAVAGH
jgi:cation/acetate symporter